MNQDTDLAVIAAKFADDNIPKEQRYLLLYFKGDQQEAYLRYFLIMGNDRLFTQHTGYFCNKRWKDLLRRRLKRLLCAYSQAKDDIDFELIERITSGKYKECYNRRATDI